jgi:hypothetical protein
MIIVSRHGDVVGPEGFIFDLSIVIFVDEGRARNHPQLAALIGPLGGCDVMFDVGNHWGIPEALCTYPVFVGPSRALEPMLSLFAHG